MYIILVGHMQWDLLITSILSVIAFIEFSSWYIKVSRIFFSIIITEVKLFTVVALCETNHGPSWIKACGEYWGLGMLCLWPYATNGTTSSPSPHSQQPEELKWGGCNSLKVNFDRNSAYFYFFNLFDLKGHIKSLSVKGSAIVEKSECQIDLVR